MGYIGYGLENRLFSPYVQKKRELELYVLFVEQTVLISSVFSMPN